MTDYDSKAFSAAHTKFLSDPTSLTDADIEQFDIVSPKLGERARAKRQNFVPAETEAERKLLNRPATQRDVMALFDDLITPLLLTHQYKRRELESKFVEVAKQLEDLTTEVNYFKWVREREVEKVP